MFIILHKRKFLSFWFDEGFVYAYHMRGKKDGSFVEEGVTAKAEMYDDDNKRRCLLGEIYGKIKKMGLFFKTYDLCSRGDLCLFYKKRRKIRTFRQAIHRKIFEIFAEFFLLGIPLFDRKIQKEKMSICFTRRKNKIT